MEAAASLTGLICFTGATLKLAAQIHSFLTTIANAPAAIHQLSQNLKSLNHVLAEILSAARGVGDVAGYTVPRILSASLGELKGELEVLEGIVRKAGAAGNRAERTWKKVKWAFSEREVERLCDVVERRKQTLGLALGALSLFVPHPVRYGSVC